MSTPAVQGRLGRPPYADRIEAALTSGTIEQRLDKIALFLAATTTSDVVGASIARQVEQEVMFKRPARDRQEGT